jgi:hypothetical protein
MMRLASVIFSLTFLFAWSPSRNLMAFAEDQGATASLRDLDRLGCGWTVE